MTIQREVEGSHVYHLFMYSMDYNILVFFKDHQTMIKIKTKTQKNARFEIGRC